MDRLIPGPPARSRRPAAARRCRPAAPRGSARVGCSGWPASLPRPGRSRGPLRCGAATGVPQVPEGERGDGQAEGRRGQRLEEPRAVLPRQGGADPAQRGGVRGRGHDAQRRGIRAHDQAGGAGAGARVLPDVAALQLGGLAGAGAGRAHVDGAGGVVDAVHGQVRAAADRGPGVSVVGQPQPDRSPVGAGHGHLDRRVDVGQDGGADQLDAGSLPGGAELGPARGPETDGRPEAEHQQREADQGSQGGRDQRQASCDGGHGSGPHARLPGS